MYRLLALFALPVLVGCHSSSEPTTIDSFRSSYFGQQPGASDQVAAMPDSAGRASSPSKASFSDRSAKAPDASQANAAPLRQDNPAPYKASVAAYIKRYAVDGNSLKLAKIGTPFEGTVNGQKGSVVCVELGGMSSNRTAYLLKDDAVADSEFGAAACRDKHLDPWDNAGT
jgi:hypothetical protein